MEEKCRHCGAIGSLLEKIIEHGSPHYSEKRCVVCGGFHGYGKKPKNIDKRGKNKHTPESLEIDFCQMCLRPRAKLGTKGVLASHHIIEIQNDGPDDPENIWVVCTSCHTIIHHQRTYLNEHMNKSYSIHELRKDFDKHRVPRESREIIERIFKLQGEKDAE